MERFGGGGWLMGQLPREATKMSQNTAIAMLSQKMVLTRDENLRAASGSPRRFDVARPA